MRWTPGSIATSRYEATPSFSPDGREMIFMSADRRFEGWRLLRSICVDGAWSPPAPPPFAAAAVIEADPGFTPDGLGLYFVSARHDPANADFDIYRVARRAEGAWGSPERLPEPVNSPEAELLPRADGAGRLYFGSARPGGLGGSDIYVAKRAVTKTWSVANLGPPVNSPANEYEAEVSRDGRTLIVVSDRNERSHLYRFLLLDGLWVEDGRIPARDDVFQVGPVLSPGAEKLLFAQEQGRRSGEIFLTRLKPDSTEPWPPKC